MKNIVILISGNGSNMQALLAANLPCKVAAVISNRADAEGIRIARDFGVETAVISHKDFPDREQFDQALAQIIDIYQPDYVVLAGFMRILTAAFVEHYQGRLINIHPSLLPAYTGIGTHARVLQDGVKIHGCTVHFVTADLDHGPIIIQAAIAVFDNDTEHSLSVRLLKYEHQIYPQAIKWLCTGHVKLDAKGRVLFGATSRTDDALISPGLM